jgi:hypothetical protein
MTDKFPGEWKVKINEKREEYIQQRVKAFYFQAETLEQNFH